MTNNKTLLNVENLEVINFDDNLNKIHFDFEDYIVFISNHHNISHKEINNIFHNVTRLNPLLKEIIDLKLSGQEEKETAKFYIYKEVISENLKNLIEVSHKNNIYFWCCTSLTYKKTFEDRWKEFENEFIDVEKIDFITSDYKKLIALNHYYHKSNYWNEKVLKLIGSSFEKKIQYLDELLSEFGVKASVHFDGYFADIDLIPNKLRNEITPQTIQQKPNKSLMFGGINLNIKDRYRILNKVLDFDKKVHPLNIGELEKYQLLAYILGIDKDNARKLMCGSHDAKDNDLTPYFNDLGLNK
jgi:hypothetical protein